MTSRQRRRRRQRATRHPTSKRLTRPITIIATLALLVILGARLVSDIPNGGSTGTPVESDVPYTPVPGAELFEVERIIDGDTLVIDADGEPTTVRLYGVDTPERGEACYAEATARLSALASDRVQLMPDARLEDRFGRWLRYVYTADAVLIDELLVAEGLGRAWREDGDLRDRILATEATAQGEAIGCLWGR